MTTRQIALPDGARARFHGWYDGGITSRRRTVRARSRRRRSTSTTSRRSRSSIRTAPVDRAPRDRNADEGHARRHDRRARAAPVWLRGRYVVAAGGQVTVKDIEYRLTNVTVERCQRRHTRPAALRPSDGTRVRVALAPVHRRVPGARRALRPGDGLGHRHQDGRRHDTALRAATRFGHRGRSATGAIRGQDQRSRARRRTDLRDLGRPDCRYRDHRSHSTSRSPSPSSRSSPGAGAGRSSHAPAQRRRRSALARQDDSRRTAQRRSTACRRMTRRGRSR